MAKRLAVDVSEELLEAIRAFPLEREIEHCGVRFKVPPFDFYTQCPQCGARLKLRSYSAAAEVEDVFDAVFGWMNRPGAAEIARQRQQALADDQDE